MLYVKGSIILRSNLTLNKKHIQLSTAKGFRKNERKKDEGACFLKRSLGIKKTLF
ncbi:hypothetical protein GOV09_04725 [Candidatus Woesearchaeota archaeon]|nr:hypothetical protein [Candidatus Woesearchaeota archaeon]